MADCDCLTYKRDVDVCGGDIEFIAQRGFDGENATWTMQIFDDKVRDFVHVGGFCLEKVWRRGSYRCRIKGRS